jgi:hypothetical protein
MAYSASHDVLTGRTVPLTLAPITVETWGTILPPDALDPAAPDAPLQCYHDARGYRCAWGHVIERDLPPDAESPTGLLLWDVILTDAQRQYHAGGGNLDELADRALVFLDEYLPHHAPPWLHDDEGAVPAACAFLEEPPQVPAARPWLHTFLTRGMPRLLAFVAAINTVAGPEPAQDAPSAPEAP